MLASFIYLALVLATGYPLAISGNANITRLKQGNTAQTEKVVQVCNGTEMVDRTFGKRIEFFVTFFQVCNADVTFGMNLF